jgi:hypothetical protein
VRRLNLIECRQTGKMDALKSDCTSDEKKEPPLPAAARSVKQGGVKVQEDGFDSPLMINKP